MKIKLRVDREFAEQAYKAGDIVDVLEKDAHVAVAGCYADFYKEPKAPIAIPEPEIEPAPEAEAPAIELAPIKNKRGKKVARKGN